MLKATATQEKDAVDLVNDYLDAHCSESTSVRYDHRDQGYSEIGIDYDGGEAFAISCSLEQCHELFNHGGNWRHTYDSGLAIRDFEVCLRSIVNDTGDRWFVTVELV